MAKNGMMQEIADSQETTLLITADQVCSLIPLSLALLIAVFVIIVMLHASFMWI
jgi:hypothetical protein